MGRFLGIFLAVSLHGLVLLFGGIFFLKDDKDQGTLREVDLVSADEEKKEEKKEEKVVEKKEELETQQEEAPDAAEILKSLDLQALQPAPELEAASLGAITDALNGLGSGSGDFGDALSFASGGRIGGTGKAGAFDDASDAMLTMTEIDQKPRCVFQTQPQSPTEMHGKKVEGVVSLIFVVDATGRVTNPRVEKSSHRAFEKPALDALKQWKFEPALKGGQRVPWKMRVSVRFQPS